MLLKHTSIEIFLAILSLRLDCLHIVISLSRSSYALGQIKRSCEAAFEKTAPVRPPPGFTFRDFSTNRLRECLPMERNYQNAVTFLLGRRRSFRPKWNGTKSMNVARIKGWLQQLGHSDRDLDDLNVIHVAGTKGKGSTCVFAASILQAYGRRAGFPRKIGLYTSPHLRCIRERIQINSTPISEELFAKYFYEVLDTLSYHTLEDRTAKDVPRYLQFLALLSFHVFIRERVDGAIYETHSGGESDATNVVQHPVVTGITTLGMDHVELLGPSIGDIAWHKAGIFKAGSPAFSVLQDSSAATLMLQQRASEKDVALEFVTVNNALPLDSPALQPQVQRVNCSLAIALVGNFLETRTHGSLTWSDIRQGIEQFSWPGRFQHIPDGNNHWFLDGAHNLLSMQKAAQWFSQTSLEMQSQTPSLARILIFAHNSQRDGSALLKAVAASLQEGGIHLDHVIFTTYEVRQNETKNGFEGTERVREDYAKVWTAINPVVKSSVKSTIEEALVLASDIGNQGSGMHALVTGSLYLVGGALDLLESRTSTTASKHSPSQES
ncbi:hypothetical protein MMC11_002374 [Xylographa trunciseda]|nr:hypothetical protein [Xylographa trunciseda]